MVAFLGLLKETNLDSIIITPGGNGRASSAHVMGWVGAETKNNANIKCQNSCLNGIYMRFNEKTLIDKARAMICTKKHRCLPNLCWKC